MPGTEGYLGVLAHHAALVTGLADGTLTVRKRGGGRASSWHVTGGFFEVERQPGDGAGGFGGGVEGVGSTATGFVIAGQRFRTALRQALPRRRSSFPSHSLGTNPRRRCMERGGFALGPLSGVPIHEEDAMRDLRLIVAAFAAIALPASVAGADVPSAANCSAPSLVRVVGHVGGVPDASGTFQVTVRGIAGNPIPGSTVVVSFQDAPDIRLSTAFSGPSHIVDCETNTVRGVSNGEGLISFTIVGAARPGPPQCLADGSPCTGRMSIYADGVLISNGPATAFDLDGNGGVGGPDLSIWLQDFGTGQHPVRADYDGSGQVGGPDLSLWLSSFGSGASSQSGSGLCP